MDNTLLYIIIVLLIVNIIVSSYNLSKVIKTEESFRDITYIPRDIPDPYDPDYRPNPCDPKRKAYYDDRYNYCIQNGLGNGRSYTTPEQFCMGWAPKCPN